MLDRFTKQLRFVLVMEFLIFAVFYIFVAKFWRQVCGEEISVCINQKGLNPFSFLTLSVIRPFLLTPVNLVAMIFGRQFGPPWGSLLTALSALISCASVYGLFKFVGNYSVRPWLAANLPKTLEFIQSQHWKIVLATRLIPLFPYDLLSIFYGLLNLEWRYVLAMSFLGGLPEIFIFANFAAPTTSFSWTLVQTLILACLFFLSPGVIIEYISRKKGSSMWARLKEMWAELTFEIRITNSVVGVRTHDPKKIPVFLVHGFFSSRKTLTIMADLLESNGFEVLSFNLGGLFGVFSTKSIPESAEMINAKLGRHLRRYEIDKINIIAHSKGGLVSLWWLLKLGGYKHCDKLITLGTPFEGSYLTWFGLLSPLGYQMKDIWQMRPGSDLLKDLKKMELPPNLNIYNIYSKSDAIAPAERGIFKTKSLHQIHPIAMHHVGHEDFLTRRDVCETLIYILGSPYKDSSDLQQDPIVGKNKHASHPEE